MSSVFTATLAAAAPCDGLVKPEPPLGVPSHGSGAGDDRSSMSMASGPSQAPLEDTPAPPTKLREDTSLSDPAPKRRGQVGKAFTPEPRLAEHSFFKNARTNR